MELKYNLESHLTHSKKVDLSDLSFDDVKKYPLTREEIRCLTYMMDIEGHTIVYLRGLLNTCAIEDPEITAFLSCWVYEEYFHGRAIKNFLESYGLSFEENRFKKVQRSRSIKEWRNEIAAMILCKLSPHFHSVYLTWGAINELTTLEGYVVLAQRTGHPILAEILKRLVRDERRHFSFYYNQAAVALKPRGAQRLTRFLLNRFWTPVGHGVKPDSEVSWVMNFTFGDEKGEGVAEKIDATIQKLPGLATFNLVSRYRSHALQNKNPSFALNNLTPYSSSHAV